MLNLLEDLHACYTADRYVRSSTTQKRNHCGLSVAALSVMWTADGETRGLTLQIKTIVASLWQKYLCERYCTFPVYLLLLPWHRRR